VSETVEVAFGWRLLGEVTLDGLGKLLFPQASGPLPEPRLQAAVAKLLAVPAMQLRPPPWMDGFDADPNGQASRAGVPVIAFPQWLRCTACGRLASIDAGMMQSEGARPPVTVRRSRQAQASRTAGSTNEASRTRQSGRASGS